MPARDIPIESRVPAEELRRLPSQTNAGTVEGSARRIDFAASLKRHKLLVLLVFGITLLCGLAIAYVKGAPKYSTSAVIFVSPRFVANLEESKEVEFESNSQYREYVQQNVRTINRFDIIQDALLSLGSNGSFWMLQKESLSHAAERLQAALTILPIPDTYQIAVSLESEKPQGLAEVVNAVVQTFLEKLKTEEFFGSDERVKSLQGERAEIEKVVLEEQTERFALAQKLGVSTFNDAFANPYDQLLVNAKTSLADAHEQTIQAEAQLKALEARPGTNGVEPLQAYASEMAHKDPGLNTLESNLHQRRSVLLSTTSGLSPDHPGRRAAEAELKVLDDERTRAFQSLVNGFAAMIYTQRTAEVQKATAVEQGLRHSVDQQAAQASEFSRGYQRAISLGLNVERERKRMDSIEDRIRFLMLERRAPGFVRLFSPARAPDRPIKGGRRSLALLACLVAALLGLAIPVGVDYLDPRIHWPGDVQRVLGIPILGWLLEKKEAGAGFEREQVLRLASRIAQEFRVNKSQIFAFTAVKAHSGTTTIVRDVALALSRLGKSALAVEANAYRADPRYRSPNSRGLSVLLRGQSDLASEIVPADDERPDSLPVGDVHTMQNLPEIQNLLQILQEARRVYSIILVDLPPILVSVDAESIAVIADVAVLVVEAETTTKKEVARAARILERVGPSAVAAMVNRVQPETAAGFGREAREEFYTGVTRPTPGWLSPWLWK